MPLKPSGFINKLTFISVFLKLDNSQQPGKSIKYNVVFMFLNKCRVSQVLCISPLSLFSNESMGSEMLWLYHILSSCLLYISLTCHTRT